MNHYLALFLECFAAGFLFVGISIWNGYRIARREMDRKAHEKEAESRSCGIDLRPGGITHYDFVFTSTRMTEDSVIKIGYD